MSATSRTNEAAERLMGLAMYVEKYDCDMVPVYDEDGVNLLDAALSEERHLTVERLMERLREATFPDPVHVLGGEPLVLVMAVENVAQGILDEIGGSR